MKAIRAVAPYAYSNGDNFKYYAFRAWQKAGGIIAHSHYPPRFLHHFAFRHELPQLCVLNKKEARLRFVQPYSFGFDTWPDHARYVEEGDFSLKQTATFSALLTGKPPVEDLGGWVNRELLPQMGFRPLGKLYYFNQDNT